MKCCRPSPAEHVTDDQIEQAVAGLRGDIDQVPSAVSAIKVDGERSYKLAREGRAVELAARPVRIARFEVLAVRRSGGFTDVDVEVDCSSGTYIRALARDVGAALGVGGHLTALRRTAVGRYGLDEARTLDDLADAARLSYSLDEACLLGFPRRDLTAARGGGHQPRAGAGARGHRRRLRRRRPGRPGDRAAARTVRRGPNRWSSSGPRHCREVHAKPDACPICPPDARISPLYQVNVRYVAFLLAKSQAFGELFADPGSL